MVNNSLNSTHLFVEKREDQYVNGTTLEYNCTDNYKLNEPETVCGVDGKWTPEVYCHPGKVVLFVSGLDTTLIYKNKDVM